MLPTASLLMTFLHRLEAAVLVPLALADALTTRLSRQTVLEQPLAPEPLAIMPPSLASLSVRELRKLAQSRGIRTAGGTRASKARRADLLQVLR